MNPPSRTTDGPPALPADVEDLAGRPDAVVHDPAVAPDHDRPELSVVVPAYNEALILMESLTTL
ncbi:hypothetical protein B7486_54105, partial [cyanobacterium TDX16]